MASHFKGIGIFLLLVALAFVVALGLGQVYFAYGLLVCGLIALAVLSIAYMRPSGRTPEHHADMDKVFNDTKP